MFDDDWHLAMASYNGGPTRVQRAMKRSGKKDFWTLSATSRYLPRETREYVPMILAAIVIAKNPAQYGFDFEPEQPARLRKSSGQRPDRSAAGRRVDQRAHRRHRGAESRAAALDDASALAELRDQGSGRHWRRVSRQACGGPAGQSEHVPVALGQARRVAADDREEADGQAGGSGGSEFAVAARPRRAGPAPHHSERADDAAGRAAGEPGARGGARRITARCFSSRLLVNRTRQQSSAPSRSASSTA